MSLIAAILSILSILAIVAAALVCVGVGLLMYFLFGGFWRKLVGSPK